jgi:hypothetical protein
MLNPVHSASRELHARSVALVDSLDANLRTIMLAWTVAASLACGIRIAVTAQQGAELTHKIAALLPYSLVVGAPVVSLMLALYWFRRGAAAPQPRTRLARFGQWRPISREEAERLPLYGVTGFMASLLVGMLINVPVRSLEFLAAIPAVTMRPHWLGWLSTLMLADVVLLSSLYCIAFAAALRRLPHFPRLLACVWVADISMQILISRAMAAYANLPPQVGGALDHMLQGNMKKALISVALWAPYLLLSRRVNLTFRHRVPA